MLDVFDESDIDINLRKGISFLVGNFKNQKIVKKRKRRIWLCIYIKEE